MVASQLHLGLIFLVSSHAVLSVDGVRRNSNRLPKMVDLTWTFDNNTQYLPGPHSAHRFRLYQGHKGPIGYDRIWAAWNYMGTLAEHGGTHMDAPAHFSNLPGALHIHEIPLESLTGPGVVIDISNRVARDPRAALTKIEVLKWETVYGRIPEGAVVLLNTGWEGRFYSTRAFWGSTGDSSTHRHPGYSEDAAKLLIKRGVNGIGIDTGSLDVGGSADYPVHQAILRANIWGLEMVKNLRQVPPNGTTIIALPMNIRGGTGAPTRVIARWPDRRTQNSGVVTASHFGNFPITSLFILLLTVSL